MMREDTALGRTINHIAEELAQRYLRVVEEERDSKAATIAMLDPLWRPAREGEPFYTILEVTDLSPGSNGQRLTAATVERQPYSRFCGQAFTVRYGPPPMPRGLAGTLARMCRRIGDECGYEAKERRLMEDFSHVGTAPAAMRSTTNRIVKAVRIIEKRTILMRETDADRAFRAETENRRRTERRRTKSEQDAQIVNTAIRQG